MGDQENSVAAIRAKLFNQGDPPKPAAKPAPKPKPAGPGTVTAPTKIRNDSNSVIKKAAAFGNPNRPGSIHPPAKPGKPAVTPKKSPLAVPNSTGPVNSNTPKDSASKPSFLHKNNTSNAKTETKSNETAPSEQKNGSGTAQSLKPATRPNPGYTQVNKDSSPSVGGFKITNSTETKSKPESATKPKEDTTKKKETTNVISVGSRTYKQLPLKTVYGGPPKKPNRPRDVTVAILQDIKKNVGGDDDFEEEDYDDVATVMDGSTPKREGTDREKRVTAVSLIQEFTEEEEELLLKGKGVKPNADDDDQEVYDDVAAVAPGDDQEEYDDIQNVIANGKGDISYEEEVYETFDEDICSPTSGNGQSTEDAEKKKKKEKEQKKKEKEEKELKAKFKIDGTETTMKTGKVLQASKGGKLDLAVTPGETIHVIRKVGNPQGKWLAKNGDGKIGYIEASNIETAGARSNEENCRL